MYRIHINISPCKSTTWCSKWLLFSLSQLLPDKYLADASLTRKRKHYNVNINKRITTELIFSLASFFFALILVLFKYFFNFGSHRVPYNQRSVGGACANILVIYIRTKYGSGPIRTWLELFTTLKLATRKKYKLD